MKVDVVDKHRVMKFVFLMLQLKASETTGTSASKVYVPRLWYFELMAFLDEKETVRSGTETLEDDNASDNEDNVSILIPK